MVDTSLSCVPASSVYCSQRSDSINSATASQRKIAASPRVRWPWVSWARTDGTLSKIAAPAVTAAPATTLFLRKERRLKAFFAGDVTSSPVVGFEVEGVRCGKVVSFIYGCTFL